MSDINTNTLIKVFAIDIIALTTFWGLINLNKCNNNLYDNYLYNNYLYNDRIRLYSSILGLGLMVLSVRKYM